MLSHELLRLILANPNMVGIIHGGLTRRLIYSLLGLCVCVGAFNAYDDMHIFKFYFEI